MATAAVLAVSALVTGCGTGPASSATPGSSSVTPEGRPAAPDPGARRAPGYYLSLGDSLAAGVQPNARGVSLPTGQGYPDQLRDLLLAHGRVLSLVKLGCPGETTGTLIGGGICRYSGDQLRSLSTSGGSQLSAALGFLRAHRGHVPLITIDIGANDLAPCLELVSAAAAAACARPEIATVKRNMATILTALRAADPHATIAGMTYYAPQLAEWLTGPAGRAYTAGALPLVEAGNAALTSDLREARARVAEVFTAFDGADLSGRLTLPGFGPVPTAVGRVCEWTWACAAPPAGPNAHANAAGYGVIAAAFYRVLRGSG